MPVDDMSTALREADLRVLLMVVFHLTGDRRWLEAPYLPARDVNLIADESAGLEPGVAEEIRAAAARCLGDAQAMPAITDPGDELMVEMMSVCLGEPVPPEYAPMMREEMGFCSRQVQWPAGSKYGTPKYGTPTNGQGGTSTQGGGQHRTPSNAQGEAPRSGWDTQHGQDGTPSNVQGGTPNEGSLSNGPFAIVVGAGASGLALGANLSALGVPYVILESNDEVGGTWYVNRYPGCGVDTPNHAYSFSFGERYPWARYFAARDQLHDYLVLSADSAGVRPNIRFGHRVTGAAWQAETSCWRVEVDTPEGPHTLEAPVLVSAIGQLSDPVMPDIDGLGDFDGQVFHTARWPADAQLVGRRVGVVGTGATAMQLVTTIAPEVESLVVFQRSAQWARPIPRYHDPIGDGAQWLLRRVPFYAEWFRFTMLWRYGDGLLPTLRKDPEWAHPERSLNRANERHRQQMTAHIELELADRPDLIEKCMPDYPPYGKRILLDNGWYQTLRLPQVELVTDVIERVTADGIRTADGTERALDVIVMATGFRVTQMAARLNIRGASGEMLAERWADDNPTAYLGITVPDFPNFFCMQGPNTGLGHGGSAIFQSECQARYIVACMTRMLSEDIVELEVRSEPTARYVASVDAEHEQLIWTHPGMSTYYRNRAGRVVSVMPWRLVDYWSMTHDPDLSDYRVRASMRDTHA